MLDFPRWKTIGISIILLLGILFAIPTFLPQKTFDSLPGLAQIKVNLGLDLAGGSHLLLEADLADLNKTQLTNMEKTVRAAMRGESGPDDDIAIGDFKASGNTISFLIRDQAQLDDARDRLFKETQGASMTGQRDWRIDVVDTTRIVLTLTAASTATRRPRARWMRHATSSIRASTAWARANRRSSAKAMTASSCRSPVCRTRRR